MIEKSERKTAVFAALLAFACVFFLIAEAVTIQCSTDPVGGYLHHTMSEFAVPPGNVRFGVVSDHSPLYVLMNIGFFVQGALFFPCYKGIFSPFLEGIKKKICLLCALLFSVGLILVTFFHSGDPSVGWLHAIGAVLAFGASNILLLFTGLSMKKKPFGKFAVTLSFIGASGIVFMLVSYLTPLSSFFALFERVTFYPFLVFEFSVGALFFGSVRKRQKAAA